MSIIRPTLKSKTLWFSTLTQFAIVSGGAVMALMANGDAVSMNGWIVAVITGVVAVAKDLRTQLGLSPVPMAAAENAAKNADKSNTNGE